MSPELLLVISAAQAVLGVSVYPTGTPTYSDSFIPAATQLVYNAIDHTNYFGKISRTATTDHRPLKPANEGPKESFPDEVGRATKRPQTPIQKQLLALHSALTKEAKEQGLAKFQGYSEEVLSVLRNSSKKTSAEQLRIVLQEAVDRGNIKRADTKEFALEAIKDLEDEKSELRKTIADLKPVQYV
ncbi:uncharacterized protein ImpE3 isoform X2 [Periplaneta americana]|uniref:uncharacterized protein ImpE3 isoform X2 n=1 Tax=Periplaneta americana TaxID=6978 RepID=UPI0037E81D11